MTNNCTNNLSVCFICGILDEKTKDQRSIVYDSPAATKKVLDVCHALQSKVNRIYVVTMARGLQQGKPQSFSETARRIFNIPVLYARFIPYPLITYLASALSLSFLVWRVIRQQKGGALHVIAYNRNFLYVPGLILARLLKAKCYLDLEDGALVKSSGLFRRLKDIFVKSVFDVLCPNGSILVTPGLSSQVNTLNNVVCYGVAQMPTTQIAIEWGNGPIRFLLGGTLIRETGVLLMLDAVRVLNREFSSYKNLFVILVTGHGPLSDEVAAFARAEGNGWLDFRGRVSREEYDEILRSSHVGLCLKLPSSEMGTTTFPSKVIEISAQGKLVLTTELGHVKDLLGSDGAMYLDIEDPYVLAKAIISIVIDQKAAMGAAAIGQQRVQHLCGSETVADAICTMFSQSLAR
jgi:glycosyltransferase involved in cell wall biosynthesis